MARLEPPRNVRISAACGCRADMLTTGPCDYGGRPPFSLTISLAISQRRSPISTLNFFTALRMASFSVLAVTTPRDCARFAANERYDPGCHRFFLASAHAKDFRTCDNDETSRRRASATLPTSFLALWTT